MQFIANNLWILVVLAAFFMGGMYYILIYLPREKWRQEMLRQQAMVVQEKKPAPAATERKPQTTPRPASTGLPPTPDLCRVLQGVVYRKITEFPWDSGGFMMIGLVPKEDTAADPVWIIYLHLLEASKEHLHRLCGDGGPCYAVDSASFDPKNATLEAEGRSFLTFLLTTHPGSEMWKTWGVGKPQTALWYALAFQKAMGLKVTVTEEQLEGSESDTLAAAPNFATLLATDTDGNPLTGQFKALRSTKGPTLALTEGIVPPSPEHRGPTLIDSGATRLLPAVADDGDNTDNNGSP